MDKPQTIWGLPVVEVEGMPPDEMWVVSNREPTFDDADAVQIVRVFRIAEAVNG